MTYLTLGLGRKSRLVGSVDVRGLAVFLLFTDLVLLRRSAASTSLLRSSHVTNRHYGLLLLLNLLVRLLHLPLPLLPGELLRLPCQSQTDKTRSRKRTPPRLQGLGWGSSCATWRRARPRNEDRDGMQGLVVWWGAHCGVGVGIGWVDGVTYQIDKTTRILFQSQPLS